MTSLDQEKTLIEKHPGDGIYSKTERRNTYAKGTVGSFLICITLKEKP